MNEKRETANTGMQQAIPGFDGDIAPFDDAQGRLRQGGRFQSFSQKNSLSDFFVKKEKQVPCCRRRIGLPPGQTSGLHAHRVNPVNDTSYAVVDLAGACRDNRPDSPPAGWNGTFFFIKMLHCVQRFYEKEIKVPCCRRRFCRSPGETPGLINDRVSPVNSRSYAVGVWTTNTTT
jgi:hypothetical protein